ncbi:MAG: hypothetical protein NC222_06110 [Staphylococcus sp.]|nr:hypothetical protein [Staphylococcus sp.]
MNNVWKIIIILFLCLFLISFNNENVKKIKIKKEDKLDLIISELQEIKKLIK